jgi:hypothetical protein
MGMSTECHSAQGEVFKIAFPRTDLNVKVGEVAIAPTLALTSWIAFEKTNSAKNK